MCTLWGGLSTACLGLTFGYATTTLPAFTARAILGAHRVVAPAPQRRAEHQQRTERPSVAPPVASSFAAPFISSQRRIAHCCVASAACPSAQGDAIGVRRTNCLSPRLALCASAATAACCDRLHCTHHHRRRPSRRAPVDADTRSPRHALQPRHLGPLGSPAPPRPSPSAAQPPPPPLLVLPTSPPTADRLHWSRASPRASHRRTSWVSSRRRRARGAPRAASSTSATCAPPTSLQR